MKSISFFVPFTNWFSDTQSKDGETPYHPESTVGKLSAVGRFSSERKAVGNGPSETGCNLSGDQVIERVKESCRRACTTKQLVRRLPFLGWFPNYNFRSAFYDCIAGVTVALTAIPQGIAYGAVAGVPVEVLNV